MKLSLKLPDHGNRRQSQHADHHDNPLLLRAKIPITIFNLPFLSGFATSTTTNADPSDLSLSLATNFLSGPTLKLSYTTTSSAAKATPPLTLTLKSGTGLFGSPHNSPLIISANLSCSPQNPNPSPTFSLHFKPRLGDFSLRKTTFSDPNPKPNPEPKSNGEVNSFGFVPLDRPIAWKDFSMESYASKDSILSGVTVMARTSLPVTKRIAVNFRWGVNFPADLEKQAPFLSVNKIGIKRVDNQIEEAKNKNKEANSSDGEMMKGMCYWMRRELDALQRENREMKHMLDEMKLGKLVRESTSMVVGKKTAAAAGKNSGGIEQWRSKKGGGRVGGGEENGWREMEKNANRATDVESELQRAIKAASSP